MAALSACMDKHTPKTVGENGNVEYTWSHDIKERIMQLHFQLVRCTPERGEELGNTYLEILNEILQHKENDEMFLEVNFIIQYLFLYLIVCIGIFFSLNKAIISSL